MRTDNDEQDQRQLRRRSSDHPSPAKNLGIAVIALTLVCSVFTAGYNWRSVAIVESNQEQFVRKDVQAEQFQLINYRMLEMVKQLEEMRAELRAARQVSR